MESSDVLDDFERLRDLERQRKITVGVHRTKANNYFYGTSNLGKFLNWGTNIFVLLSFVMLVWEWKISFAIMIFIVVYVIFIQKIVAMIIRIRALKDKSLFLMLYRAGVITVRDNESGNVMRWIDV